MLRERLERAGRTCGEVGFKGEAARRAAAATPITLVDEGGGDFASAERRRATRTAFALRRPIRVRAVL
jgi:hypothetical protein